MTIFLCGFMGCGKTTVGNALAKFLDVPLIDTDEEIVKREKRSIPEIFEESGEPYFRKVEAETVCSLCSRNAVVACGGGAMLNCDTAAAAKDAGAVIVLIDQGFETCYERIKDDKNRPIVQKNTKEQLLEIYNARIGIYKSNSTTAVSPDKNDTPFKVAKSIADKIKQEKT